MADQNLGTYSPEDMIAIISVGEITHAISGWAEGTFLTVERTHPTSTLVQGADTSGGRIFRSNKGGSITFMLQQFSSSNDVMSAILQKDGESRDNTWLFNLTLKDGTGRSVFHARQCFIENVPHVTFGTEAESRSWVIRAIELNEYVGGNAVLPPDVVETLTKLGVTVEAKWI